MGNRISFNSAEKENKDSLSMSNGLTDVLIDYLLLSGSELADCESEKRMVVFLAEKQQTIIGLGNVDFDIVRMPWQQKSFEMDKSFLLKTVRHARQLSLQKKIWALLCYEPNREHIDRALDGFEVLIKRMSENNIDENNLKQWLSDKEQNDSVFCGYPKCLKHGLILSFLGCKMCNDGL